MLSIEDIAKEIVTREGGFVNDPDDLGGATNLGVTLKTLRDLGYDLTKDGKVTIEDLKALTKDQATALYLKHYFYDRGLDALPKSLQPSVFDMAVNAGSHAIRILQRLLVDMGYQVVVDGALGSQTLNATRQAYQIAPALFVDAYGIARRNYYYQISDARRKNRKFAKRRNGGKGGWIKRAEVFISPDFHLTHDAHAARTAHW